MTFLRILRYHAILINIAYKWLINLDGKQLKCIKRCFLQLEIGYCTSSDMNMIKREVDFNQIKGSFWQYFSSSLCDNTVWYKKKVFQHIIYTVTPLKWISWKRPKIRYKQDSLYSRRIWNFFSLKIHYKREFGIFEFIVTGLLCMRLMKNDPGIVVPPFRMFIEFTVGC